jgi:hypothetical protein
VRRRSPRPCRVRWTASGRYRPARRAPARRRPWPPLWPQASHRIPAPAAEGAASVSVIAHRTSGRWSLDRGAWEQFHANHLYCP